MNDRSPCRTDDEIRLLVERMLTSEVREALAAHRLLAETYLPWVERKLVWRARRAGKPWAAIGRLLGRSRQALQQRYDRITSVGELTPPALPRSDGDRVEQECLRLMDAIGRGRRSGPPADTDEVVAW